MSATKFDRWFWLILLAGILLRLITALSWENITWPDEIHQSLEQAHLLVFGYGLVPWEFQEGLRSFIVPLFFGFILFPFKFITCGGSAFYALTVRVVLCLLSTSLIIVAYQYGRTFGGRSAGLWAAGAVAVWYEFLYFAPKALSDMLGTYVIFPAVFLAERGLKNRSPHDLGWAGALFALAAMIRYQNLPLLIVPPLLALLEGGGLFDRRLFRSYCSAALGVIICAGIIDHYFWGGCFHSLFRTFTHHIIQGGASEYGALPQGWYCLVLWQTQNVFWPIFLGLAVLVMPKLKLLWSTLLIYFLLHLFVPHKEYRFIFLCLPLLITAAMIGAAQLSRHLNCQKLRRAVGAAVLLSLLLGSFFLGRDLRWGSFGYRSNFIDSRQSAWTVQQAHIRAYLYLSTRPDLTGLLDLVDSLVWSPGYYYLHRWVPLQFAGGPLPVDRRINYVLIRGELKDSRLEKVAEFDELALYHKK